MTNPAHSSTSSPEEELLAPHSTTVIPPMGYTDFIKEGLKDAGLLQRRDFFTPHEGDDSPTTMRHQAPPAAASLSSPGAPGETQRKELHNATYVTMTTIYVTPLPSARSASAAYAYTSIMSLTSPSLDHAIVDAERRLSYPPHHTNTHSRGK